MADDPTPLQRAEDAVCEAIEKRARDGGSITDAPTTEGLKALAEGVAAMKHGPQGGDYESRMTSTSSTTHTSDDHRTDHQGEDRPRPQTGFGS